MSKNNLSSNNEPLVKLSPKRKRTRASARLQQVHEEKGQVDNTPSGGQPDLSEPLGHEAPTSTAYSDLMQLKHDYIALCSINTILSFQLLVYESVYC